MNPVRVSENRRPHHGGFTLIELLVVVAIIAILASLLLPGLAGAKKASHKTACTSNLHNVGLAVQMYADDNRGLIPRGNNVVWFLVYMPYMPEGGTEKDFRNVKIFHCPSYPDPEQTISYVVSSWTFRNTRDSIGFEILDPTPLSRFQRPSDTIYIADNEDGSWRPIIRGLNDPELLRNDVWHPGHISSSRATDASTGRRVANDRHNGGPNVLYYGGNVGWMKARTMTVNMWREIWSE